MTEMEVAVKVALVWCSEQTKAAFHTLGTVPEKTTSTQNRKHHHAKHSAPTSMGHTSDLGMLICILSHQAGKTRV